MIAKHPDRTFINTSMEGAKIKGTIDMHLEQALEEHCNIPYDWELDNLKEKLFAPIPLQHEAV